MKTRIIIETIFLFIFSIFIFYSSIPTFAQECPVVIIETLPGNREEIQACECNGDIPSIVSSSETISSGGSITLHVDSGGLACPPYTWVVEDAVYSLSSNTTENDLETVTLTAQAGACGGTYNNDNIYTTITVTDNCGVTDSVVIRNISGTWVYNECVLGGCGTNMYGGCWGDEMGSVRYIIQWKSSMWSHLYCDSQTAIDLLNSYLSYGFTNCEPYCIEGSNKLSINGSTFYTYRVNKYIWSCP